MRDTGGTAATTTASTPGSRRPEDPFDSADEIGDVVPLSAFQLRRVWPYELASKPLDTELWKAAVPPPWSLLRPVAAPPPQAPLSATDAIIILDWDDTLFPSTWLQLAQ